MTDSSTAGLYIVVGIIVGIVITVVILIVGLVVYCLLKKRMKR